MKRDIVSFAFHAVSHAKSSSIGLGNKNDGTSNNWSFNLKNGKLKIIRLEVPVPSSIGYMDQNQSYNHLHSMHFHLGWSLLKSSSIELSMDCMKRRLSQSCHGRATCRLAYQLYYPSWHGSSVGMHDATSTLESEASMIYLLGN